MQLITNYRACAALAGLRLIAASSTNAQQKDPAVEVYALTGSYYHGNAAGSANWEYQFGAGILAPITRKWAAILDVTTSESKDIVDFDGQGGPYARFRERRYVFAPSIVRMWRFDRFSFYAGGGIAAEHMRQRDRVRENLGIEDGQIKFGEYQDFRSNNTNAALLLRGGTVFNVTHRIVARADFSFLPRYTDERPSKSITFGVGYRF